MSEDQVPPAWKRLLTPWKVAALLIAAFLLSEGYLTWRDSFLVGAINDAPAFGSPELKLSFSKKIQYDPLTFVGRGAHAGFWTWSPQGLQLTPEGEKYFRMDGDTIVSQAGAGRRKLSRIRDRVAAVDGEKVTFFYRWEELSPVTTALLSPPPKLGDEYLADAIVTRRGGAWQVVSTEARDFEEPLQRVQDAAAGVRR